MKNFPDKKNSGLLAVKKYRATAGFTLVELMIALFLGSILTMLIFTAFRSQEKSYETQEETIDMQQNMRAALEIMSTELRMAGYDPDGQASVGITTATEKEITFSFISDWDGEDNDSDTDTDEFNETLSITYDHYDAYGDGDKDIGRCENAQSSTKRAIAENIEEMEFYYTLEDGTKTTDVSDLDLEKIVSMQISILARTARPAKKSFAGTFTAASGADWSKPADGYRRLLLSKTVYFRNM